MQVVRNKGRAIMFNRLFGIAVPPPIQHLCDDVVRLGGVLVRADLYHVNDDPFPYVACVEFKNRNSMRSVHGNRYTGYLHKDRFVIVTDYGYTKE